jgi:hypothetical protein
MAANISPNEGYNNLDQTVLRNLIDQEEKEHFAIMVLVMSIQDVYCNSYWICAK